VGEDGPYTVEPARAIEERHLDVRTIVPVHGPPVSREYLEQALAIRRRHAR